MSSPMYRSTRPRLSGNACSSVTLRVPSGRAPICIWFDGTRTRTDTGPGVPRSTKAAAVARSALSRAVPKESLQRILSLPRSFPTSWIAWCPRPTVRLNQPCVASRICVWSSCADNFQGNSYVNVSIGPIESLAGRRPMRVRQWSIQSRVSFSSRPFCSSRARKFAKSTWSIG